MKSIISKIYVKLGNPFSANVIRLLNKERFFRSMCNVTNARKPFKKSNHFVAGKDYNVSDSVTNRIGIFGYSLLSIPIAAFALGTWQVQRLQWKVNLVEKLKSCIHHEPIELPENLEDLKSKEYYPIKVKGTFLYDKEFVMGFRSLIIDGKPAERNFIGMNEAQKGYYVITPFKLADRDLTILVNRGWVPRTLKHPAMRQENHIEGETEIVGLLRLDERRPNFVPKNRPHIDIWYYRDLKLMAKQGECSPIYIELISKNNHNQYPIGSQTKVELRNEHFSYLLTWYCLSATTAYLWYRKFIKGVPFVH